ncbi:4-alpha-glucanotransferase [Anaeromicropila herbilytica]|uniref:4-alpha-glucanotransferase n=1 Tax=Anaeromicropila herbilytica TaxID=2785025 RepID=A0A7R7EKS9_9FIRM|nr:4-alpha-glucanotransferase [Anaeromicropila herbilytica]BCN30612.1 4-alpha-glucanotransferase [Anaeromicropila herbilytica]
MRASGILLPIASLPSAYGIGCFSKEAYLFVDQLKKGNQKYWQILPLGATGYGDSPYQSFSTFAGNPYYIDLEQLIEEGLLTKEECEACDWGDNIRYVDYEKVYLSRYDLLRKAYDRVNLSNNREYHKFKEENTSWLDDYSLYMAIKVQKDGLSWQEWKEDIRIRSDEAMEYYQTELAQDIEFYCYLQYLFFMQWAKLKSYANDHQIQIIGDIPIYVALDSADAWANSNLFMFDDNIRPTVVAGCPPDAFAATGQLWGNPIYRWEEHKKSNYHWWIERMKHCAKLYDVIRIDHFRGFDEYYAIPYGHITAEYGEWKAGPGYDLIEAFNRELEGVPIIAEDLGYLTDSVKELLDKSGYPGMKVLQFAFDSREKSNYLPHCYDKNCVVYTGTHDNDTLLGWYRILIEEDKEYANAYADIKGEEDSCKKIIRLAYESVANLVIIPIQDFLELGSEARINIPSTLGNNWKWRLLRKEITDECLDYMKELTMLFER